MHRNKETPKAINKNKATGEPPVARTTSVNWRRESAQGTRVQENRKVETKPESSTLSEIDSLALGLAKLQLNNLAREDVNPEVDVKPKQAVKGKTVTFKTNIHCPEHGTKNNEGAGMRVKPKSESALKGTVFPSVQSSQSISEYMELLSGIESNPTEKYAIGFMDILRMVGTEELQVLAVQQLKQTLDKQRLEANQTETKHDNPSKIHCNLLDSKTAQEATAKSNTVTKKSNTVRFVESTDIAKSAKAESHGSGLNTHECPQELGACAPLPEDTKDPMKMKKLLLNIDFDVSIEAVLLPVDDNLDYNAVPIHSASFSIGADASCDLCLTNYGNCCIISDLQAVISFDELTFSFCLINFAGTGTVVDNLLYGLDSKKKRLSNLQSDFGKQYEEADNIPCKRRKIMNSTMPRHTDGVEQSRKYCINYGKCSCVKPTTPQLWHEGPAVLNHGSVISFGCIKFTFVHFM